jgi:hypothetical protein
MCFLVKGHMHHGGQNEFPVGFLLFFVLGILKIDWSFDSMPPLKLVFDVTQNIKLLAPSKVLICHGLLNGVCDSKLMHFRIS